MRTNGEFSESEKCISAAEMCRTAGFNRRFSDLSDVISYTTDKMSGASVVAVFCV
jgi:hypothetical protein